MAAIGEAAAQDLIARAAKAGITAQQIADELRIRPEWLENISGARLRRANQMIETAIDAQATAAHRAELLDQVEHIARLLGHDPVAKRAAAEAKLTRIYELETFVRDCAGYARSQGLDPRTPAQKQAAATRRKTSAAMPATDRQIDYITELLARRIRNGEGGGFASTARLYDADGTIHRAAIAALTTREASTLIDSLTGNY